MFDSVVSYWAYRCLGVLLGLFACRSEAQPVNPFTDGSPQPPAFLRLGQTNPGFSVNPLSREEVRSFFNTVFQSSESVPLEWTGSLVTGNPGTTSPAYREAAIRRVNYFRAMAGLPANIALNDDYSRKSQQAAFMMSANTNLNHFPPTTWLFYTADGAEAARNSNLSIGRTGPDAVLGQMQDSGANNAVVGHRRWILYPHTRFMGSGDVPGDEEHFSANSLWVFDTNALSSRPVTRDEFVAWPPRGYVPFQLVFARWSFAFPNADFSGARVSMTRAGTNVPVRLEAVRNGFGENTLVWIPDNLDANDSSIPSPPASDTTNSLVIENVRVGASVQRFAYDVVVFNPTVAGADTRLPMVTGPATAMVGERLDLRVSPVSLTPDYQWRAGRTTPFTLVEGGEQGLANMTAATSPGYDPIARDVRAAGQASFHLACPDFEDQYLVLERTVIPGVTSELRFRSRLGLATANQIAVVQVSTDDGSSWTTVYRQVGNQTTPENSFVTRTISLSAYAGRSIRLRFGYLFEDGLAFPQTNAPFGWYIDEITMTSAQEFVEIQRADVPMGLVFSFQPEAVGELVFQARGRVFGSYFVEWGPATTLQVAEATSLALLALKRAADGGLELVLSAQPGRSYAIELSTDLVSWTPLPITATPGTTLRIVNSEVALPRGFYRAVSQ